MFLYVFETLKMVINPKFILPMALFLGKVDFSPFSFLPGGSEGGDFRFDSVLSASQVATRKSKIFTYVCRRPPSHESAESLWIEPRKTTYVHT